MQQHLRACCCVNYCVVLHFQVVSRLRFLQQLVRKPPSDSESESESTVTGMKDTEVASVNTHRLGESFVEKVSDDRRQATVDGKAAAPEELYN
jgi:hypothetical protein